MNPTLFRDIRVLVVDDDEEDYLIVKKLFSRIADSPFQLEWCGQFDHALDVISQQRHDVYLIDYRLGAHTGNDLLKAAGAVDRPEPFVLLTGVGDSDVEFESLKLAAADYLVKSDLSSSVLSRTLYYALGRKEIERSKIEQLIELNRSKDEFISIASHQLRTPATAVKQYLGMAVEGMVGNLSPAQQTLLDKAYRSNERQLAIINDLLKVAQIDAGSTRLNLQPVDLSIIIRSSFEDIESMIEERQQRIELSLPPSATATVDAELIRMVVDNLLDNASKYTPERGSITVTLAPVGDEWWDVSVSDNGVGVADPSKLFAKFSRINNQLSTKVGGSGLGLYWAQSVAELHGGTLRYEPVENEGSTFVLRVPKHQLEIA